MMEPPHKALPRKITCRKIYELKIKGPCRKDTANSWYSPLGASRMPMPIPTPRGVIQQKPVRAKRNEDVRRRDLISSKLMQNTITTLCTHIAKTERIFIGFIVVNQIPMKRAQTPVVLSSTPTASPSSKQ